jgi:integrase
MEEKHEEGRGAYIGSCVFGAIKVLSPRAFDHLVDARAVLSDWNAAPASHWPPLPLPIVLLFAYHQLETGASDVALAFIIAFFGLLRVSEVSALTVADVIFNDDRRFWGLQYTLLILQHTKTGDDKSAELRQAWVWPLLRSWVLRKRSQGGESARLFPSPAELRAALAKSVSHFHLEACGFVMHSFRAGGALYLINLEVAIDEVLRRGRWRRPESARPYIQRLRALGAYSAIGPRLLAAGAQLASAPSIFFTALR